MRKKIIFPIFLFVIIALTSFKIYYSSNYNYKFIYPSWWHSQLIENGNYFDGLVFSIYNVDDSEISSNNGGYITITTHQAENDAQTVGDYIKKLQGNEELRIKSGFPPTIPGPSQYKLFVAKNVLPSGFEEVSSLYSFGSDTEAHEYWRISNNKLYIIRYEYPNNEKQKRWFELGKTIIFWTFKLF